MGSDGNVTSLYTSSSSANSQVHVVDLCYHVWQIVNIKEQEQGTKDSPLRHSRVYSQLVAMIQNHLLCASNKKCRNPRNKFVIDAIVFEFC